jgi:Membrane bound O-acyl transferase family
MGAAVTLDRALVGIVVATALLVAIAIWDAWAVRLRGRSPWPAMLAAFALPLTIPVPWTWPRIFATVLALTLAGKSWAVSRSGPLDRRMLADLPHFAFWLIMPPESRAPDDASAASATRSRGVRRVVRGAIKLIPIAALLQLEGFMPSLHVDPWIESAWALWLCWLAMSTLTDVVSGLAMLTGIDVVETFDTPPLARSPREFWGRRWNLYIAGFFARHVFTQLGGRRHPLRATMLVFLASGIGHELFVVGCMGRIGAYPGWMLAFFTIHGIAVVLQMIHEHRRPRPRPLPRALAVALHFAWFLLTAPLFFRPLGQIFG